MVRKRDWVLIPGLLVGLGLTIVGCSQSDTSSTSRSNESQPPRTASPSSPPAQSAPGLLPRLRHLPVPGALLAGKADS